MEPILCQLLPGHWKLLWKNNVLFCPTKQTKHGTKKESLCHPVSNSLLLQASASNQHSDLTSKDTGKEDTGTWACLWPLSLGDLPHLEFSLMDWTPWSYSLFHSIIISYYLQCTSTLKSISCTALVVVSAFVLGMIWFHWLHWAAFHWSGDNYTTDTWSYVSED